VEDIRLGSVIRALRLRRGWTQVKLAGAAQLSPAAISRLERGRVDATTLAVLRRVFGAMDARIDLVPRWHGGDLDRLVDARHAGMRGVDLPSIRRRSGERSRRIGTRWSNGSMRPDAMPAVSPSCHLVIP
jgi:transcriptional regulator with XRE-family HTH domain